MYVHLDSYRASCGPAWTFISHGATFFLESFASIRGNNFYFSRVLFSYLHVQGGIGSGVIGNDVPFRIPLIVSSSADFLYLS